MTFSPSRLKRLDVIGCDPVRAVNTHVVDIVEMAESPPERVEDQGVSRRRIDPEMVQFRAHRDHVSSELLGDEGSEMILFRRWGRCVRHQRSAFDLEKPSCVEACPDQQKRQDDIAELTDEIGANGLVDKVVPIIDCRKNQSKP
ncbi:MAG: hypothetical protein AAGA21_19065 [Pseudomonadota bacterium]